MHTTLRCLLLTLAIVLSPGLEAGKPMRVAFLAPAESKELFFWQTVIEHMNAAAKNLGIQLTVQVAKPWAGERAEQVKALLNGPDRPDYFITTAHMSVGTSELEIAEEAKVPVFLIDAGLLEKDLNRVGGPREHFSYWIGQMLPLGDQAGYDQAKCLIQAAKRQFKTRPIEILALGGRETDLTAIERSRGLQKAVAEERDVRLMQLVTANWDPSQARQKVPLMLKRYPNATVIWAANDAMAHGAISVLESSGRSAGKDILVGGIDWDPWAMGALRRGEMVVNVGGHFLDGVWALVLLYDHHEGIDFAKERVDWRSSMLPVTKVNQASLNEYLSNKNLEHIDFKAFSKKFHPELKHYRFTWDAFLDQHRKATRQP